MVQTNRMIEKKKTSLQENPTRNSHNWDHSDQFVNKGMVPRGMVSKGMVPRDMVLKGMFLRGIRPSYMLPRVTPHRAYHQVFLNQQ